MIGQNQGQTGIASLPGTSTPQYQPLSATPLPNLQPVGSLHVPMFMNGSAPQFGAQAPQIGGLPPQDSSRLHGFQDGDEQEQYVDQTGYYDGGLATPQPSKPGAMSALSVQAPPPMEPFQFGGIEPPQFAFGHFPFSASQQADDAQAPTQAQGYPSQMEQGPFTFAAVEPETAPKMNGYGHHDESASVRDEPTPAAPSSHAPRFGEPGYKSPFDVGFSSSFGFESSFKPSTYTSPVEEEQYTPEEKVITRSAPDFSYASPQHAGVDNGPWIPLPYDESVIREYNAITNRPLPECWIKEEKEEAFGNYLDNGGLNGNHDFEEDRPYDELAGRRTAPSSMKNENNSRPTDYRNSHEQERSTNGYSASNSNHHDDSPNDKSRITLPSRMQEKSSTKTKDGLGEHAVGDPNDPSDPWNQKPRFQTTEELDYFWSQNPMAVKTRSAILGPRKPEELKETNMSFIVTSVSSWVTSSISDLFTRDEKPKELHPPVKTRGATLAVHYEDEETKYDKLDITPDSRRGPDGSLSAGTPSSREHVDQMHAKTMAILPQRSPPVPTRSWCCVRTIVPTQSDGGPNLSTFTDKETAVQQPDGCPEILAKALCQKMRVQVACKKGTKDAPNHDGYTVVHFDESYKWGPLTLYGVFDGHGPSGETISAMCIDLLPKLMFEQFKELSDRLTPEGLGGVRSQDDVSHVRKAMEGVFVKIQQFLEHLTSDGTLCSRKSGSTATLILSGLDWNEQPYLLVSHVGDSRAALIRSGGENSEGDKKSQEYQPYEQPEILELTRDHRPESTKEKLRIERSGARVEAFPVDKGTVRPMDPRVLSDGQTWPALNMSRCVGDLFSHTQGVIELPDVRIKDVQFGDKVLICTDGVWDVIPPADVRVIVEELAKRDPYNHDAAEAICKEARKRWLEKTDNFHDDITAMVIEI